MISEYNIYILFDNQKIGIIQELYADPDLDEIKVTRMAIYNDYWPTLDSNYYKLNPIKYIRDKKIPLTIIKEHSSGKKWEYNNCIIENCNNTIMAGTITIAGEVIIKYSK